MPSDEPSRIPKIHPTGRRCIHQGLYCPYNCQRIMGGYGARSRRTQPAVQSRDKDSSQTDSESSGVDEVDHCVGFQLQKSFSASRANIKNVERKSETPATDKIFENSFGDSRQRSNSLPATPASDLSSSDRYSPTSRGNDSNELTQLDTSTGHASSDREQLRRWTRKETREWSYQNIPRARENNVTRNSILGVTASLILAIIIYSTNNKIEGYKLMDFQNDLSDLGKKYNMNSDTMLRIQAGISTTFKLKDTASIVFLYDDTNMDEDIVKKFVNEVAYVSAKFLRNETGTASHIVVENSDLSMSTAMELISRYRVELEDQGVLLVQDLENVPVNLAMAFHYYCDEQDPLVKKTAILFTLNIANCHNGREGKNVHDVVEKCLSNKWQRLEKDMLVPLLNRVANVVVDLESGRH